MFPTTIWTTIRHAGAADREALESFALGYRPAVLAYIRGRGFAPADAEDLCQEVFLRILASDLLAKADAARGRFRFLLLTVVKRTIADRLRRRTERPVEPPEDLAAGDDDESFDEEWVLHLTERALRRLRERSPSHHDVLVAHLEGRRGDRQRLWLARKKLSSLLRDEVAQTCSRPEQLAEEWAHVSRVLDSGKSGRRSGLEHESNGPAGGGRAAEPPDSPADPTERTA